MSKKEKIESADNSSLDIRTLLYAVKDELELSMIDFDEFIQEQYPLITTDNVKKNYLYAITDNYDIIDCLTVFIHDKIVSNDKVNESFDENDDIHTLVYNNIDIFADITNKEHDTYIIEINK